jgi:DNA-binding LacI/PurR family transcriptional regulator
VTDLHGEALPPSSGRRVANIRLVARRAGVSASTASRALRDTLVTPATRDRVLAAARELGYVLPTRAGDAGLVAVLTRFPSQWYFAEAITALEQALVEQGHRVVLHNMSRPESRAAFFDDDPGRGRLHAVVVISTSFTAPEQEILAALEIPIVVVGGHLPGRPTASIDERAGARTATEHLIGLGHRQIGMLSFDPDDPVGVETTTDRRRGFEDALEASSIAINPDWMISAEGSRMAGGRRAAEQLLSRPQLPTAIFAMSDELAIGALRSIRRAGLTVPGHLSVVGFDDHEMAEFVDLTTIHQPVEDQVRAAAAMLATPDPGARSGVQLPVRIVVRGTTSPPR